jgi:hypothetical protein
VDIDLGHPIRVTLHPNRLALTDRHREGSLRARERLDVVRDAFLAGPEWDAVGKARDNHSKAKAALATAQRELSTATATHRQAAAEGKDARKLRVTVERCNAAVTQAEAVVGATRMRQIAVEEAALEAYREAIRLALEELPPCSPWEPHKPDASGKGSFCDRRRSMKHDNLMVLSRDG